MTRWTGFTNQVSDGSKFTNSFVDNLNISKSVELDASGNQIITKRHGMYQKKIYNPVINEINHFTPTPIIDMGDYYIFYLDGTTLKVANCSYPEAGIESKDTKTGTQIGCTDSSSAPITFHCKRFSHNVPTNGTTVTRDLYFIATSLYINPAPYLGWTNFAAANPTFGLVTNNANAQITLTTKVLNDLKRINAKVNREHAYAADPSGNDNWRIMEDGETGDCEDFALTKADLLLKEGYPASALHMEAARIEGSITPSVGHAWLVVQTTGGDYALDVNHSDILLNSAMTVGNAQVYCRRRQIGSNWSFISPFGWMMDSVNNYGAYYDYILDPLLNIFYPINFGNMDNAPLMLNYALFYADAHSVNFSEDNNSIYVSGDPVGTGSYFTALYRLDENNLSLISSMPLLHPGVVKRDGTLFESDTFDIEVISPDGFYDYRIVDSEAYTHFQLPWYGQSKLFGASFNIYVSVYPASHTLHTPWGESLDVGTGQAYFFIILWQQTDADNLLIQSLRYNIFGVLTTRLYKDGVSILSEVLSAVGTTEANLLGFVYIPSTDRLNQTTAQEKVRRKIWNVQQAINM
jgi:predicted transglutaminase-like cysteine proteinase